MENTAEIVASNINGDEHELIDKDNTDKDPYQSMQKYITNFKAMDGLVYIYTLEPVDENTLHFVLSNDDYENNQNSMDLTVNITDIMRSAYHGNIVSDSEITSDEWESYISGYAPIYNSNQEVIGIVDVDYSAESIYSQAKLKFIGFSMAGFIYCFIYIITFYILLSRFSKSLRNVSNSVRNLSRGDGDLTCTLDIHTGDELEIISDDINHFTQKICSVIQQVNQTTNNVTTISQNTAHSLDDSALEMNKINASMNNLCASTEEIQSSMESINDSTGYVLSFLDTICTESKVQTEYCKSVN